LVDPQWRLPGRPRRQTDALARQESLPEVQAVLVALPAAVAGPPEATIFDVSSSAPHGG
jgi:hypothetical protein